MILFGIHMRFYKEMSIISMGYLTILDYSGLWIKVMIKIYITLILFLTKPDKQILQICQQKCF